MMNRELIEELESKTMPNSIDKNNLYTSTNSTVCLNSAGIILHGLVQKYRQDYMIEMVSVG